MSIKDVSLSKIPNCWLPERQLCKSPSSCKDLFHHVLVCLFCQVALEGRTKDRPWKIRAIQYPLRLSEVTSLKTLDTVLMPPCTSFGQAAPLGHLNESLKVPLIHVCRLWSITVLHQPRGSAERASWCPVLKVARDLCWIWCWWARPRPAGWWRTEARTVSPSDQQNSHVLFPIPV